MPIRKIALAPALALALAACGGTVNISPTELPNAVQNVPYNTQLTGTGKQPIAWKLSAGALPPGITLNQGTGLVSGTPTGAGKFTFSVNAEDSSTFSDATGHKDFSLTVIPELKLAPNLPPARRGEAYSTQLTATGGVQPYTFTVVGLGAGMSFDAASNTISGTPPTNITRTSYALSITVADSGTPQQSKAAQATLTIRPPGVSIASTALPQGQVNQAYSFAIQVENGSGNFSWSVSNGLLPDGLALNTTTGELHGTPTAAANTQVEITVTDQSSQPDQSSKTYNLVVVP